MFRPTGQDDEPIESRFQHTSPREVLKLQRTLREESRTPLDILIEREEMREELSELWRLLAEEDEIT